MASDRQRGTEKNPLVSLMHRLHVPVTRDSYLALAHMGRVPKDLSPEHEEEMPSHLRKKEKAHGKVGR
jgi:hypothetical protein